MMNNTSIELADKKVCPTTSYIFDDFLSHVIFHLSFKLNIIMTFLYSKCNCFAIMLSSQIVKRTIEIFWRAKINEKVSHKFHIILSHSVGHSSSAFRRVKLYLLKFHRITGTICDQIYFCFYRVDNRRKRNKG